MKEGAALEGAAATVTHDVALVRRHIGDTWSAHVVLPIVEPSLDGASVRLRSDARTELKWRRPDQRLPRCADAVPVDHQPLSMSFRCSGSPGLITAILPAGKPPNVLTTLRLT